MFLDYGNTVGRTSHVRERHSDDTAFLDDVLDALLSGHVQYAMAHLGRDLYDLYASTSTSEWEHLLQNALLAHPLKDVLMRDPVTARAFHRPRGYAGDARLLDMLYYPDSIDMTNISPLGQEISRFITNSAIATRLSKRIQFVGSYIDILSENVKPPRIMSVAGGHCREIQYSRTLQDRHFERFVALDHDPITIQTLQHDYGNAGVETVAATAMDIVKGTSSPGQFDLIYSVGLYDYLGARFAQQLTASLYDMLAPGGTLMIINITENYDEIGYVESYMNWSMLGRSALDMLALADALQTEESATLRIFDQDDISSHFNVLEIHKGSRISRRANIMSA